LYIESKQAYIDNSVTIRAASICIFSRRLQFACPQLSQTSEAYSKIGRNKEAPDYLYELVPPLVAANVNYNLRNSHNIHILFNRLSVYQNSYFPCTIQAWN
jgi:hypothetical protein